MLAIRNEQIRVLLAAMRDQFVDRMASRFATLWPLQTVQLGTHYRSFLQSSLDRALAYGVRTESDIARFTNLYFVWGPNFEMRPEHAWALRILTNPKLNGPRKIRDLAYRTGLKLQVQQLNKRPSDVRR